MESKWLKEKDELNRLINIEKVSYEEIGRRYGCSGSNIKKVAKLIGIELPLRRKINPNEHFNKKEHFCLNCGKEIKRRNKFCDINCLWEYKYKQFIEKWLNKEESGIIGTDDVSSYIKRYLFKLHNNSCEKCGWNKVNEFTGRVPLQIHHIDGDCTNNYLENLQLLCPNCHSLTENFGSRNKNCTRKDKRVR